jgi:thiol-disulfide isomerase/thioredoxin
MKSCLLVILCAINFCCFGQISTVVVNPSKPEAGQRITVTYTGKLVKEGTKMTCISHNSNLIYSETKVVPCKMIDNQLIGVFTLSDSVSYFTFKIENKKEIDNNDGNGFGFNIYKDGKAAKRTFLTEGYFMYLNRNLFNGNYDPEKAIKLFEKEYELNPELKEVTFGSYIQTLARLSSRKTEAIDLAQIKLKEILTTGKYERSSLSYIYLIAGNNNKVADSLKTLFIKKYPTGIAAFFKKLEESQFYSIDNPDKAIEVCNSIKNNFPKLSLIPKRLTATELFKAYAFNNDSINFEKSLKQYYADDNYQDIFSFIGNILNEVAWRLYSKKKNLNLAKSISEKSIEAHLKYDTLSTSYGNALDTYAAILFALGEKEKALANQRKAVNLMNYSNISKNQNFLDYLIANKHFEEAKLKAKEFMSENLSNSKIDSLYAVASTATNSKVFDNNYTSIKENSDTEFAKNIKNKLIDIAAPDFELKDLNGKTVKLSDLRGNIVILDFWATWCGPCIKAFPAMKKTMSELKDQPVKFLFIDTFENVDKEITNNNDLLIKIKKTLNNKNVNDFVVVLDQLKNNYYEATESYKVPSIPAKYIIDRNGRIRYKSTGFSSDENLIKELKTVVKLISE